MMTDGWRYSSKKIGDKRCLSHPSNSNELLLLGKYGYIYPDGVDTYTVVITSKRIAQTRLKIPMRRQEEVKLPKTNEAAIQIYVNMIKAPRGPKAQLALLERL